MTLLIISFLAGVLTILAPCILPLLPVIVGRSISDTTVSKRRVFIITLSLGASVIIFTLLLKATTLFIDIPQDFWKWFSGTVIFIFGLVSLFPELWEKLSFVGVINRKSNQLLTVGYKKDSIWGDVIVGASLGPIFSACSPTYFVILATVLPATPVLGVFYLFVYALGLSLALLVVSLVGQKIMMKIGIAADPNGWFKRILGIIFIAVALLIITGYDKKLQVSILDAGFFDVTKIELKLLQPETSTQEDSQNFLSLREKSAKYSLAPDISSPDGFINTRSTSPTSSGQAEPITISEFKGQKVVLLDIWTYSCINCIRTLPHLNELYRKYEDQGLVVIGLHTPEFAFEKVQANVENAVRQYEIKYPVVLDNDFSTWNAYGNRYWPHQYLIDMDGYIVYDHIGEGGYEETEDAIQKALSERNSRVGSSEAVPMTTSDPKNVVAVESGKVGSPEIYFGSSRSKSTDKVTLGGTWNISSEYVENVGQATIAYSYDAKNVYFVAGSKNGVEVEIYKDGILLKTITVKAEQIYTLIEGDAYGAHRLQLKVKGSGLQAFTFTFG